MADNLKLLFKNAQDLNDLGYLLPRHLCPDCPPPGAVPPLSGLARGISPTVGKKKQLILGRRNEALNSDNILAKFLLPMVCNRSNRSWYFVSPAML